MDKRFQTLFLLLLTFAAAVCFKNDFLRFLLGFEVLAAVLAFLEVRLLKGKTDLKLGLPETVVYREEHFPVRVTAQSRAIIPISKLSVQVGVLDKWASREMVSAGSFNLDSKECADLQFSFDSIYCGVYEVRIRSLRIWDHLGIFSVRTAVKEHARPIYVLPAAAGEHAVEGLPGQDEAEGDQSIFKHGSSSVDTSNIREYRDGDDARHIHWKLSVKTQELLVREMGEPQEKMTRIYLNLQHGNEKLTRDQWETFLNEVARISRYLIDRGVGHYVSWIDIEVRKMIEFRVTDTAGLQEMLCGLLHAITWQEGEATEVLEDIRWNETMEEYIEVNLQGDVIPPGGER